MANYVNDCSFADDILIEILKLLPVDKLFALKPVCKRWEKIISSDCFRRTYQLEQNSLPPTLLGFHRSEVENAFLPTYDMQSRENRPDPYLKTEGFQFIDSSNGFLLFYNFNETVYRVCNPVTKQFRDIYQPYSKFLRVVVSFDAKFQKHGSGLVVDKFELVFLVPWLDNNTAHLYTLLPGATSWTERSLSAPRVFFRSFECAVVIKGVYYWHSLSNSIFAYDSTIPGEGNDGVLDIIPLHERIYAKMKMNVSVRLTESSDGLLQYTRSDSFKIVVWVLTKDSNEDGNNWVFRYAFSYFLMHYQFPEIMRTCDLLCPQTDNVSLTNAKVPMLLAHHPSDPEIAFLILGDKIISFCFRNGRLELVCHIGDDKPEDRATYFNPPWNWYCRVVPYFSPSWASRCLGPPSILNAS